MKEKKNAHESPELRLIDPQEVSGTTKLSKSHKSNIIIKGFILNEDT